MSNSFTFICVIYTIIDLEAARWGDYEPYNFQPEYCVTPIQHDSYPCYIFDEMEFSFLFQYQSDYPSFYQMNVLQYPQEREFFYQRVTDAELLDNRDGLRNGADVHATTKWKKQSKTIAFNTAVDGIKRLVALGVIYRRISRTEHSYNLVEAKIKPYASKITQHGWTDADVINSNERYYFSHFEPILPKYYTVTNFQTVLNHQLNDYPLNRRNANTIVAWMRQSMSFNDLVVNWITHEYHIHNPIKNKKFSVGNIYPLPYVEEMVNEQREFSKWLLSDQLPAPRLKQAVRKVMQKIWSYVNAIEGITIHPIQHVIAGEASLEDKKQNVVKHFSKWATRRVGQHMQIVYPGEVSSDYDTIEQVVDNGNVREMLLLINAYGYVSAGDGSISCKAFWDVIFAFSEKDIAENALPAEHSKYKWDPFYIQWFNQNDINRRKTFLLQIHGNVFENRARINNKNICMDVRWQRYGESNKCAQEESVFDRDVNGARMKNWRKGAPLQQDRWMKVKDVVPELSQREKDFIIQQATNTHNFGREKMYSAQQPFEANNLNDANSEMKMPWFTAYSKLYINYRIPCYYNALHLNRLSVAGPSKSSDLLMDIAVSFGLSTEELFFYELGIIGWMGLTPSHSIIEVLLGFPYDKLGIHDEYKLQMDPYEFIRAKLNEFPQQVENENVNPELENENVNPLLNANEIVHHQVSANENAQSIKMKSGNNEELVKAKSDNFGGELNEDLYDESYPYIGYSYDYNMNSNYQQTMLEMTVFCIIFISICCMVWILSYVTGIVIPIFINLMLTKSNDEKEDESNYDI